MEMESADQRQGELRTPDIHAADAELVHQRDNFLKLCGVQREQGSVLEPVIFPLFLEGLKDLGNVLLRDALHGELEVQPVSLLVPAQADLGRCMLRKHPILDRSGRIDLKQRLQQRDGMMQEVEFPVLVTHDISALRPREGLMGHQVQNPPLGFSVPHQNDLAAPLMRLLFQRIDDNPAILEFKPGEQPVPYPVQIESRVKLGLDNPVRNGVGNAHPAQLLQPGNDGFHEGLHLLRRNRQAIPPAAAEHPLQLGEPPAFLRRKLQQPALGQDHPVALQNRKLLKSPDIQPVAVLLCLVELEAERQQLLREGQAFHQKLSMLKANGRRCF